MIHMCERCVRGVNGLPVAHPSSLELAHRTESSDFLHALFQNQYFSQEMQNVSVDNIALAWSECAHTDSWNPLNAI